MCQIQWESLDAGRLQYRRSRCDIRIAFRKRPAVIKLNPAETAMIQFATQQAGRHIPKAAFHLVDLVSLSQLGQTAGSAAGTTANRLQAISETRNRLLGLAFLAFIDRQVAHALNEAAVGALHPSPAAFACEHGRLYLYIPFNAFCTILGTKSYAKCSKNL